MRALLAVFAYVILGSSLMVGAWWWQRPGADEAVAYVASGSFAYPTVQVPAHRDSATWRAAHLDGWKWAIQHISDGWIAEPDQLRGFLVGEEARDAAFVLGYTHARAEAELIAQRDGGAALGSLLRRLKRSKPAIYDISYNALPPP
jgi:hypothetical protein